MQDYLGMQEKYTAINFQFNKLNKDNSQLIQSIKEKEEQIIALESERNLLSGKLKRESDDKMNLMDSLKSQESFNSKVSSYSTCRASFGLVLNGSTLQISEPGKNKWAEW